MLIKIYWRNCSWYFWLLQMRQSSASSPLHSTFMVGDTWQHLPPLVAALAISSVPHYTVLTANTFPPRQGLWHISPTVVPCASFTPLSITLCPPDLRDPKAQDRRIVSAGCQCTQTSSSGCGPALPLLCRTLSIQPGWHTGAISRWKCHSLTCHPYISIHARWFSSLKLSCDLQVTLDNFKVHWSQQGGSCSFQWVLFQAVHWPKYSSFIRPTNEKRWRSIFS